MSGLSGRLQSLVAASTAEVSLVYIDMANGERIDMASHVEMHAASTMKVAVLYELFRRAESGDILLDEATDVRNEFRSLIGSSTYSLSAADDSDSTLYQRVGGTATWRELASLMIARSSNLATNILIDRLGARRIRGTMESIGASEMRVLRGVEDGPAFRAGLNNTTTAAGLAALFEAIVRCRGLDETSCSAMIAILAEQEFNEMIPAGLPPGTPVAHKTGWITGIRHDGGIVFPPDRAPFVLVILTRGFRDGGEADRLGSRLAREIWESVVSN